jgi:GT2 family glycosyltransferase
LHVEVIVADNASSDGSADMVVAEFPQVRLLCHRENLGFARANNAAAAVSSGRYLLFLNSDTLVGRNSLAALLAFMRDNPQVGMVGPRLIGRDGRPQPSYRGRPTARALLHRLALFRWLGLFRSDYVRYRRQPFESEELREVDTVLGAAVCLPREVFLAHDGWDEKFPFGLEDFDLSARVARTHAVVFFPGAEIVHLGRMSSRHNSGFAFIGVECGYARYLRKHILGRAGVVGYKLLLTLNLPLAMAAEGGKALWRRWRRGPASPDRPHSELGPLWHFTIHGLPLVWRS